MPTAGWILEGARDRFLEGTTSIPNPGPPPVPRFACPFCKASFAKNAELRRHTTEQHIGSRPFIMLGGAEPASTDVVRTALRSKNVALFNTTAVYISYDGSYFEECGSADLGWMLATRPNSRIWLRLENQFLARAAPVRTEYDLAFKVYSQKSLIQIDRLFVAHLGRADPSVAEVDQFLQKSRAVDATEYADALGDYVLGVLVKDGDPRAGVRQGERDYRRRYNSALRTLQSFDRPLAQLVCGLIRFSSNDFGTTRESEFKPLDSVNAWLAKLAGKPAATSLLDTIGNSRKTGARVEVCPIDNGSDAVFSEASYLASRSRWSADIDARMSGAAGLAKFDPLDRVKLLALWADTAIRLGQPRDALGAMRKLVGNDCFGEWAERSLQEYGQ